MSEQTTILPAAPNTLMIRFRFFLHPPHKLSEVVMAEHALKRPVLGYKVMGDKPVPIALAMPEREADFVGVECVVIPGFGVLDLDGTFWKDASTWVGSHCLPAWRAWLIAHGQSAPSEPTPFAVLPRAGIDVSIRNGGSGGFGVAEAPQEPLPPLVG